MRLAEITRRPWRHYHVTKRGQCSLQKLGQPLIGSFELGIVETGRSRVFAGYFVRVTVGMQTFLGEDSGVLLKALRDCAAKLKTASLELNAAGLSPEFGQTGLSFNSSVGYIDGGREPVHMMSPIDEARQVKHGSMSAAPRPATLRRSGA